MIFLLYLVALNIFLSKVINTYILIPSTSIENVIITKPKIIMVFMLYLLFLVTVFLTKNIINRNFFILYQM